MTSLDRFLSGALISLVLAAVAGVSGCSSSESAVVQNGGGATGLGGAAGGAVAGQAGGGVAGQSGAGAGGESAGGPAAGGAGAGGAGVGGDASTAGSGGAGGVAAGAGGASGAAGAAGAWSGPTTCGGIVGDAGTGSPLIQLAAPASGALVTDSRQPKLSWGAVDGATKYEVWINVTRTDYRWDEPGNFLDRYTKVGESPESAYTPEALPDRWTYRWCVVAVKGAERIVSETRQFGVYLPTLEQVDDGIPIVDGCRDMNRDGKVQDYENWKLPVAQRVDDLMKTMTLEEKAYQMFYVAKTQPLSGFQMGPPNGGAADVNSVELAQAKTRLGIPSVWAGDTIHGFRTTYPAQCGLAASRDPGLAYRVADMQRVEQVTAGYRGVLGPLAEVGTKVLYARIQEGNGEDADLASAMVRAMTVGLQGGPEINPSSVLVAMKHWAGQGAGGEGTVTYDATSIKYHMRPWIAAVEANAGSIMPGYSTCPFLDPSNTASGYSPKILGYLRDTIGFKGFVVTDWLGSWQVMLAGKAGADVMGGMNPDNADDPATYTFQKWLAATPVEMIDTAVRRILTTKFSLGIFENPYGDVAASTAAGNDPAHKKLAVDAALATLTLMRNPNKILPLKLAQGDNIVVTGANADNGSAQSIWTSYFHGKTILGGLKERAATAGVTVNGAAAPKVAIVVVGEKSYTHGSAWPLVQDFLPDTDKAPITQYKGQGVPVVVVMFLPRPYVIADWHEQADAIVAIYRPGDGGGEAVAKLLFGDATPRGKLPWHLPRSMDQVGDESKNQNERWDLPFDLGATDAQRTEIRALIDQGKPVPPTYGDPLYRFGDGLQAW